MDISRLGILILKLYRFKDEKVIDQITDEFLKVVENPGTGSEVPSTLSGSDPDPGFSPAMNHLIEQLRPMTDQQLTSISDLIEGGSRIDQIARLIDLELVGIPHDTDEYDKITAIQTILIELRAGRKKKDQSQINKFNARYGKK